MDELFMVYTTMTYYYYTLKLILVINLIFYKR